MRGWGVVALAVMAGGCLFSFDDRRGDAGGTVYPDAGGVVAPVDPRPPAERACPTGGVLTARLWRVYATPRQPDGSVWDGLSAGKQELLCRVTGQAVRAAVRYGLNEWAPGSGTTFDQFAGSRFQSIVAEQCGVGLNWLQEQYEGPDLFALGSAPGAAPFQSVAEQDTWQAPRVAASWSNAVWRVPCGDASTSVSYEVSDEDLAFDDQVETTTTFVPGAVPPQALCNGWGWLEGREGLVGTLIRFDVSQATQACEGLFANSFRELVIPTTLLVPAPPGGPTAAGNGGP